MIDVDEKSDLNSFRNHFGIKRNQSPIKDNRLRAGGKSTNKTATSLRRFSSSPEVSSEKSTNQPTPTISKAKSDSSDSEDDEIDEMASEVARNETTINK